MKERKKPGAKSPEFFAVALLFIYLILATNDSCG
jgi:hypothetical protein